MADHSPPENGIFILSCPRSGSTMLRHIVDGHEKICSPDELELGALISDLHLTVDRTLGRQVPQEERTARVNSRIRQAVDDIMEEAASIRGKTYWCEKTPDDTEYIETILNVYPDARYVCLYRNCMDVVNSILERAHHGVLLSVVRERLQDASIVDAAVRLWVEFSRRLLQLERTHPEQTHRVKYEDVVFESRETLRGLFEFLGVDWYESLLTDGLQDEHEEGDRGKVLGADQIRTDRVGNGSRVSIDLMGDRTRALMNDTLETLGYPPVEDDFNVIHSPYVPAEHRTAASTGTASAGANGPSGGQTDDPSLDADDVHRLLRQKLAQNASIPPLPASIKIVIDDIPSTVWTVDLAEQRVQRGGNGDHDCTVALDTATLVQVADGSLNTTDARVTDRLRFRGDETIAQHLGKIF
jgi:hypothetical protein